ncbi:hypothetical protein JTB14_033278 [Gonioctena quinquepunctata]|nr:hypothetical protein JTB14_033278 [Gonioctena quinquepunctata]
MKVPTFRMIKLRGVLIIFLEKKMRSAALVDLDNLTEESQQFDCGRNKHNIIKYKNRDSLDQGESQPTNPHNETRKRKRTKMKPSGTSCRFASFKMLHKVLHC